MHSTIISTSVALVLATASLGGHHYSAAIFESSQKLTLTGTLTTVDWRNPHIEFSVQVKVERGAVEVWRIEAMGPGWFRTRNISRIIFDNAIGQTITVEALRAKDGSRSGLLQKITLPDGNSVAMPAEARTP